MLLLSTFLYKMNMSYKKKKNANSMCYSQSIAKFLCQLVDAEIAENSYGTMPIEETEDKNRTMTALEKFKNCARR